MNRETAIEMITSTLLRNGVFSPMIDDLIQELKDNTGKQESTANGHQVGSDHYQTAIQTWDYIQANGIPYLDGNVIKYVSRHAKKNGKEDLLKAKHYIDKIIEVHYEK